MMDHSHKIRGYNGDSNLETDGILYRTPFEMLFWAFDEEFDHLSFLVKICNFKSCKLLGFGEKSELMFFSSS
jgi:hypothetical protein